MLHDLRLALRSLRRNPRFTILAITVIALGIGANAAIFSGVYSVLLRPLAFEDPGRLVTVWITARGKATVPVSPPDFREWQEQARSFTAMAAAFTGQVDLTGREAPEQIPVLRVDGGLFRLLGVRPALGRTLTPEDARGRVVVLTHRLWQRRFGGDPGILGQSLRLSGADYEVVGVMPPSFEFPPFWATGAQMYLPMDIAANTAQDRGAYFLRVFARLRPGVEMAQARAEIKTIAARQAAAYPETNTGQSADVIPLHEMVVGKVRRPLLALLAAVGFLLLTACVNVANLVLARSTTRQSEMAVRVALGAAPWRLARHLLAETAVLAGAGGALGVWLAASAVARFTAWLNHSGRFVLPRPHEIGLHLPVLGFAVLAAVAACVLCGLAPAAQAWRTAAAGALRERGGSGARAGVRDVLVVVEIAAALLLTAGAGLALRSFTRMAAIDPGFRLQGVLTANVSVTGTRYQDVHARIAFFNELMPRLAALPGVTAAGAINHLPLGGDVWAKQYAVQGRPEPRAGEAESAVYRVTQPGYFAAMGTPLLAGRDFDEHDGPSAPAVAIVNQALARRAWPGGNPVGKRLRWTSATQDWMTVVGVVHDVRQSAWAAPPEPEIYQPYLQNPASWRALGIVLRTSGNPAALAGALEREVWKLDRDVPVADVLPLASLVDAAVWPARFSMLLLGGFGALALILAAAGIYGVMSYTVACRAREIGIRMALGADRASVLAMVAGRALRLCALGIVTGTAGAAALTRLMAGLLYETSATDPLTYAATAAGIALVALAASWAPASRASGIDPAAALR